MYRNVDPRYPLRQIMALFKIAKLIFVRMYEMASEYDSSFFSAIFRASCFIVRVAEGPAPPMHEKTGGVKELFYFDDVVLVFLCFQRFVKLVCVASGFRT